jgi:hypothetical protein
VAVVHLVVELVARDRDLLGVHDDDEVAGVDVRRVLRLALAAQRVGDLRSETPEVFPSASTTYQSRSISPGFAFQVFIAEKRRTQRPPAANRSSPARNSAAPPWLGWRTYVASERPAAQAADGDAGAPRRARSETAAACDSRTRRAPFVRAPVCRVGRDDVPAQRLLSSSSSASVARTIVAVASAGPAPVSWRSEVNGMPETPRAAVAGASPTAAAARPAALVR